MSIESKLVLEQPRNSAEARLKAAVVDRLFATSHVDSDSVLISEMVVANWSRRADLVLANGSLWAFEIKSEADNLVRLPGQIDTLGAHFEKLVVVAAAKFEVALLETTPPRVGVWIQRLDGSLVERRRPQRVVLDSIASTSLMTVPELRAVLQRRGIKCGYMNRKALQEAACLNVSASRLAEAAREAIKARHRPRFDRFAASRIGIGTLSALASFRRERVAEEGHCRPQHQTTMCSIEEPTLDTSHPDYLLSPSGPILRRRRAI